ncbi:MAG: hypothetical protein JW703_00840 [Candidatus Diapherotrites archaeon]|nr:hypothetical protein [Candidatus Diapherotrites archaeon]
MNKLSIPGLGVNESTKSAIITVLGQEFPLTAKEIHNRLKHEFGLNLTYQSVHKSLNELIEDKIIEKEELKYKLNSNWIKKIVDFGKDLDSKYFSTKENVVDILKKAESGKIINLVFENFNSFAKFLVNGFLFAIPSDKVNVCVWNHVYGSFGMDDSDHEAIKATCTGKKHYSLCKKDTFLDRWFSTYLSGFGKKFLFGADYSIPTDSFVQDDFILQAFLPRKLLKNMDYLYSKVKHMDDLSIQEYFDLISNLNEEINVTVFKNAELADSFRKEVLALFGENE